MFCLITTPDHEHRKGHSIPSHTHPPSLPGFESSKWKIPAISWVMCPFLVEPQVWWNGIKSNCPDSCHLEAGEVQHLRLLHLLKQNLIGLAWEVCVCACVYTYCVRGEVACTVSNGEFQQRKRKKILVDLPSKGALLSLLPSPTPNSQPVFQLILPRSTFVVGDN